MPQFRQRGIAVSSASKSPFVSSSSSVPSSTRLSPPRFSKRLSASQFMRLVWVTSTRRRPIFTSRSEMTCDNLDTISARRAKRVSGWPRSFRIWSETMEPRMEGGSIMSIVGAGGSFSFRIALNLLSLRSRVKTRCSSAFRCAFAVLKSGCFDPTASNCGSGQTCISATSKGSNTDIATASVRWFVRWRPTRPETFSLVWPT